MTWATVSGNQIISIHAPREGSDIMIGRKFKGGIFLSTLPARGATLKLPDLKFHYMAFLSTLPARGATLNEGELVPIYVDISIHAPREGSDLHRRGGLSP